jgi:hypothetical protein
VSRSALRLVLVGVGVSLLIGMGLSHLADENPDGLEAAFIRAECADADDGEECLDDAAGEPVFGAAPLPDYEITWLSGLLGVALCFALAAGLVAMVRTGRGRRDGPGDHEVGAPRDPEPTDAP